MKKTIKCLVLAGMLWMTGAVHGQVGDDAATGDYRVQRILEEREIIYEIDSDGDFKVTFDLGEGRSQLAFIMSKTNQYGNLEIREIWSIGYRSATEKFPAAVANLLLEDTLPKKLGGWAKHGDLAVFMVRISANADAESLMNALTVAMQSADEIEERLTGSKDEF